MQNDKFIDLKRTFYELSDDVSSSDDAEISAGFGITTKTWTDTLDEFRVVILSEAGSGKTEEIRHATRLKRDEGKPAFFLRIEYLKDGLDDYVFDEGRKDEFERWLASNDEGWLFLDSVDEAKLRHPKDFEKAILRLSSALKDALQRTHIFITSRATGWRPASDLKMCKDRLPYKSPAQIVPNETVGSVDELDGQLETDTLSHENREPEKPKNAPFKILSLRELTPVQIRTFVEARGVRDSGAFMDAIERANAWNFATRPLDLVDVADFWRSNKRIGSRRELMEHNVLRKLEEPKQEFREEQPLSPEKARAGARCLAAATILIGQPSIRVPDGAENRKGFDARLVLPDWTENETKTLLARPIFDEALYGAVRFHHREVREYLAAEWLCSLLQDASSRRAIEARLFKTQFGMEVLRPKFRPVLPWLCLLDERVFQRVQKVAPELIFEGGDPAGFSPEVRAKILTSVCEDIHAGTSGRSMMDYSAVQRFANADIGETVRNLLETYSNNEHIIWFLLRMVWHGRIRECLPMSKAFALDPDLDRMSRQAAIRALAEIGTPEELSESFESYLTGGSAFSRELLGTYIECFGEHEGIVEKVARVVQAVDPPRQFEVDGLSTALRDLVSRMTPENLVTFVETCSGFLKEPPFIERRHCDVSIRHTWLLRIALSAVERLVDARHPACLSEPCLHILQIVPIVREFSSDLDFSRAKSRIPLLVKSWDDLNWALFWFDVAATRSQLLERNQGPLEDYYRVGIFGRFWSFTPEDINRAADYISERSSMDDQKVAISLAFQLYQDIGRPREWRERLKRIVKGDPVLKAELANKLSPPAMTDQQKRWRQTNAGYERRRKAREKRDADRDRDSKKWLSDNVDFIRHGRSDQEPGAVFDCHIYLYEKLEREDGGSRYSRGNWQSLIEEYGEDVAAAFRDWSRDHWRAYPIKVRSEGVESPNQIPFGLILALVGLQVESQQSEDWISKLSAHEVEQAAKLAIWEINGFPDWLSALFEAYPQIVLRRFVTEADWELLRNPQQEERLYVFHDLNYHTKEIARALAPHLAVNLKSVEPTNADTLRWVLNIVLGSDVPDTALSALAKSRIEGKISTNHLAYWYAVWVATDPDPALPSLQEHLRAIEDGESATNFAIEFIGHLVGSRHERSIMRDEFVTSKHLCDLYLLMHEFVREENDIRRANQGVYSPGPRDAAQEGRNYLFSALLELPGKETFLALQKISELHPIESSRAWMQQHMKRHAAKEADESDWTPNQFLDFAETQEKTPANHAELFDLVVARLFDLKTDLEDGDASIAEIVRKGADGETEVRNFVGNWCRQNARGRYSVPQEEEMADATRPDIRFQGNGFDAPVPVEMKLAENWSGPALADALDSQLCKQYLRDDRSSRGVLLVVKKAETEPVKRWNVPGPRKGLVEFDFLSEALQEFWMSISDRYPGIEEIEVIGIDLTKRLAVQKAKRDTRAAKKRPPR